MNKPDTLPLWHPCATRGCLTFVPVRGEVCRWCKQAAAARDLMGLFESGRVLLTISVDAATAQPIEPLANNLDVMRYAYALHEYVETT